ncbi:MAG: hypothetical protein NC117_02730 [Pseudoflavonifractor sp.]|nr:hypothetical protein [Pseudoflavonifractor sp.]
MSMIDVKMIGKRRGGSSVTVAGGVSDGTVSGTVVREALHAAKADIAETARYASSAGTATEATHATSASTLDDDTAVKEWFLSRLNDDTALGLIRFIKGLSLGEGKYSISNDGKALLRSLNTDGSITADEDVTAGKTVKASGVTATETVTARRAEVSERVTAREVVIDGDAGSVMSAGFDNGGMLGQGLGLWRDAQGLWHVDADVLTARMSLKVLELVIQKIKAVGGSVVVSQASGVVEEVRETGTGADGDSWYRLYLTPGKGDGSFTQGDYARCSRWDGGADGGVERIHGYWEQVVKADTEDGRNFIALRRPTSTGTVPAPGDEVVLMGSDVPGRQGYINVTVEDDRPRIAEYDGCQGPGTGTVRTCLGDLSGMEWHGRTLSGYGLMTRSLYADGELYMTSSEQTVTSALQAITSGLDDVRGIAERPTGTRNLIRESGYWRRDSGLPRGWGYLNGGCAVSYGDRRMVMLKTSDVTGAAAQNGLHATPTREAFPAGTRLTVIARGTVAGLTEGHGVALRLYNTSPSWSHSVTLGRITSDGAFDINEEVVLGQDFAGARLGVVLQDAPSGTEVTLEYVGLYEGGGVGGWSAAPEDTDERLAEATASATAANTAAKGAQSAAGLLGAYIDGEFRDGVLTAAGAGSLWSLMAQCTVRQDALDTEVSSLGLSEHVAGTAAADRLDEAWQACESAYTALLGLIADVSGGMVRFTDEVRDNLSGLVRDWGNAITLLTERMEECRRQTEAAILTTAREAAETEAGKVREALGSYKEEVERRFETTESDFTSMLSKKTTFRIGGRNLVPDSGRWTGRAKADGLPRGWTTVNNAPYWNYSSGRLMVRKSAADTELSGIRATLTTPVTDGTGYVLVARGRISLPGQSATATAALTLYNTPTGAAWGPSQEIAHVGTNMGDGSFDIEVPFTVKGDYTAPSLCLLLHKSPQDTVVTLDHVALYEGDRAPGWIPAPEDNVTQPALIEEIKTATSEIEQTIDGITQRVGKTETDISTIRGETMVEMERRVSEIQQTASHIGLTVEEGRLTTGTCRNMLHGTGRTVTGWATANSGGGTCVIGELVGSTGRRFTQFTRPAGAASPTWETFSYCGTDEPVALVAGERYTLRVTIHLAQPKGTVRLMPSIRSLDNSVIVADLPTWVSSGAEYETRDYSAVFTAGCDAEIAAGKVAVTFHNNSADRSDLVRVAFRGLQIEPGETAHDWTPSALDASDTLRRSGIDIGSERITLTSDNVVFRNSDGEETAALDSDGRLKAALIEAEGLTVQHVVAGDTGGQRVEIDPGRRTIDIFNADNEQVVAFDGNIYGSVAELLGGGTTERTVYDGAAVDVSVTSNSSTDKYPSPVLTDSKGGVLLGAFHTDTPGKLMLDGFVSVSGTYISTGAVVPSLVKGSVAVTLTTYADAGCTDAVSTVRLASAGLTDYSVHVSGTASDGDKLMSPLLNPGWHVITASVTTGASGRSSVTARARLTRAVMSYEYYIGRFFGNGLCIGKAGEYAMIRFDRTDGMEFEVVTGDNGLRVTREDGVRVRTPSGWRLLATRPDD